MEWWSEAVSFLVGLVSGAGLKVVWDRSRRDSSSSSAEQIQNTAGGHIGGRDVNVGKERDEG